MYGVISLILIAVVFLPGMAPAEVGREPEKASLEKRVKDLTQLDLPLPDAHRDLSAWRNDIDATIHEVRDLIQRAGSNANRLEQITSQVTAAKAAIDKVNRLDCRSISGKPCEPCSQLHEDLKRIHRTARNLEFDEPFPWPNLYNSFWKDRKSDDLCKECKEKFDGALDEKSPISAYFEKLKSSLTPGGKTPDVLRTDAQGWLSQLNRRRNAIEQKMSDSVARKDLATSLPLLIGVIGLFSIGAMVVVRCFDPKIQKEWVASGQVIQFVTVMILLTVILALGLVGILKENTLGTLLGGIGGYVLAQGVGRAAARAATREPHE